MCLSVNKSTDCQYWVIGCVSERCWCSQCVAPESISVNILLLVVEVLVDISIIFIALSFQNLFHLRGGGGQVAAQQFPHAGPIFGRDPVNWKLIVIWSVATCHFIISPRPTLRLQFLQINGLAGVAFIQQCGKFRTSVPLLLRIRIERSIGRNLDDNSEEKFLTNGF